MAFNIGAPSLTAAFGAGGNLGAGALAGGAAASGGFGSAVMGALGGPVGIGLMGLQAGLEVGGRMSSQIGVTLLYDKSPVYACALPVVTSLLAAGAMLLVRALEHREEMRAMRKNVLDLG